MYPEVLHNACSRLMQHISHIQRDILSAIMSMNTPARSIPPVKWCSSHSTLPGWNTRALAAASIELANTSVELSTSSHEYYTPTGSAYRYYESIYRATQTKFELDDQRRSLFRRNLHCKRTIGIDANGRVLFHRRGDQTAGSLARYK